MKNLKIGVFTDSHFSSKEVTCGNRYNNLSLKKINAAFKYFLEEKCDLVICLGDLIDKEDEHTKEIDNLKKISEDLSKYHLRTYVLMGNHDAFAFDEDEFYDILGEQYRPVNEYACNKNLIFIDACYFKNGNHYRRGDSDWTDTYYPKTNELETLLTDVTGNTYIFMHQNIDPAIREDHRLFNADDVRVILEKSNKVKMVIQGHYHPGHKSEFNKILYVAYPAMCENESAYYVMEI